MMRKCPICAGEYASVDYGASYYCRPCMAQRARDRRARDPEGERAKNTAWKRANPDRQKAWNSSFRERNLEKCRQRRRANYAANREAELASSRAWKAAHPENNLIMCNLRRARKKQAIPSWYDRAKVEAIYAEAARLTRETGIPHHVDHVLPLQSKFVCGLHWHGNLQILPKRENLMKKNRFCPDTPLFMEA